MNRFIRRGLHLPGRTASMVKKSAVANEYEVIDHKVSLYLITQSLEYNIFKTSIE